MADELADFNFNDFIVQEKLDGSMAKLFYFEGQWLGTTRGSFGELEIAPGLGTWQENFCRAMGISSLQNLDDYLDRELTYVCEFVSPYNKVVRKYPHHEMYLLSIFNKFGELNLWDAFNKFDYRLFNLPKMFSLHSIEDIEVYLKENSIADPTFEGVVIRDNANRRWKLKSDSYKLLHYMRGEGDNRFLPKYLVPCILAGEQSELLTFFDEVKDKLIEVEAKVDKAVHNMLDVWLAAKDLPTQKEFAQFVLPKTELSKILFDARSQGVDAEGIWRNYPDLILKKVFP